VVNDEKISGQEKKFLFVKFDKILGLGISRINKELGAATERVSEADIPLSVMLMLKDRETARAARDWRREDLRRKIYPKVLRCAHIKKRLESCDKIQA